MMAIFSDVSQWMGQDAFLFSAIIFFFLLAASLVGGFLKWRIAAKPHAVVDNLNARIKAWWVMVLVLGVAFALGPYALMALFFLISFFALREFMTLTPAKRSDYYALLAAFYVVLPVQYILIAMQWYGLLSIFIPVYAFLLLPILSAIGGETRGFMARTSTVQWGIMIAVYCISMVPALLIVDLQNYVGRNMLLIAWLVLVVQSSDILQYVCGKILGKTKIAPVLSPSKTVEGFVGGVLLAALLGASLYWITPFGWWQALLMALLVNLMGFAGGLVMSAIKRDRGVKDWGHMIEGHGGMLDRLDSICFAAPVFFHLVRYFWAV